MEQLGLQEDLAVGDGDDVGWDISGNVTSLRLDNGQSCQRAAALFIAQFVRHVPADGYADRKHRRDMLRVPADDESAATEHGRQPRAWTRSS